MPSKTHNWLCEIGDQPTFRNLPDFDCGVFRAAGDDIIIMWAPLYI